MCLNLPPFQDDLGLINVVFTSTIKENYTIQLIDGVGKVLFDRDIEVQEGENSVKLNMENTTKGIYFVKLKNEKFSITRKVIIP